MWPEDAEARAFYEGLFEKLVKAVLTWKDVEHIKEPVPISDFEAVRALCNLYEVVRLCLM